MCFLLHRTPALWEVFTLWGCAYTYEACMATSSVLLVLLVTVLLLPVLLLLVLVMGIGRRALRCCYSVYVFM